MKLATFDLRRGGLGCPSRPLPGDGEIFTLARHEEADGVPDGRHAHAPRSAAGVTIPCEAASGQVFTLSTDLCPFRWSPLVAGP